MRRLVLAVFFFVNDFGINDIFVLISGISTLCIVLAGLGIQCFADLGLRLLQFFKSSLDFVVVILFLKGFLESVNIRLNFSFYVCRQLLVVVFEQLVD